MSRPATPAPDAATMRLAFAGLGFAAVLIALGFRMADLAVRSAEDAMTAEMVEEVDADAEPFETADAAALADVDVPPDAGPRAPIVDRRGAPLAHSLRAFDLYLDASQLSFVDERIEAAARLARLFPELDGAALEARFVGGGTAMAHDRPVTPMEAQDAHDLGVPGLYASPRLIRVYHAGSAAAHVLGYVDADGVGRAGVEGALDDRLRAEPETPLRLSIDLRAQLAAHARLSAAMADTGAIGGAVVVMSARTGEIYAMVSAPEFDPHAVAEAAADPAAPLFDRASAGRYELGSVLKTLTWALALEEEEARFGDIFDASEPIRIGAASIGDAHAFGRLSFEMAFARSSNVVAARLALRIGRVRQRAFFERLGLFEPTEIELLAAFGVAPRYAEPWGPLETATISFGHGVALTPVHLAAAVASIVNGGERVRPTMLALESPPDPGERVVSPQTSHRVRELLRLAVTDGTGRAADIPGLEVGGKTGTADKPGPDGYAEDRTIATFVAAFPISSPEFVVVAMLDEASVEVDGRIVRSASRTAAPLAGAVIADIAGILGVAPR